MASGGTFYKCSSGVKRIAISPTGSVYPCQGFIDTKLEMGSILDPYFDHRQSAVSQCMSGRNIATLLPCRNCVFSALCPHNVDCAARAHYSLGGLGEIDVNGMCRVGFDLMDTILFESELLPGFSASIRKSSGKKEK
jgi:radical SAM protein with 4Fe4S-binding SPASM domain